MSPSGPTPATYEQILVKLRTGSIIDNTTNCWIWQGAKTGFGYGRICWQGHSDYIHRVVFENTFGYRPAVVRHSCDNPSCWNPDHLIGGTHADNVKDKVDKGRHNFGTKNWNNVLTEDDVREIKRSAQTITELAKRYNVGKGTVHSILNGRSWKHIT